jgi:kynurenine formamidase
MCSPLVMATVIESVRLSRRSVLGGAAASTFPGLASIGGRSALSQDATPAPIVAPVSSGIGEILDLSHVWGPGFPMFPGALPPRFDVLVTIEANGFFKYQLTIDEHTGTHMDAPVHFIAGGVSAADIDVDQLVAPLAVVDISDQATQDADAQGTIHDLLAWEAEHGELPAGALVALHSGWEARVSDPGAFLNVDSAGTPHFPGWHPEAAAFLVEERDIVGVGVDTISIDFGASTDFGSHVTVLGAGKYGLENLANLGAAPPAGATVIVGGPRHEGGSGGPTRVLALT